MTELAQLEPGCEIIKTQQTPANRKPLKIAGTDIEMIGK